MGRIALPVAGGRVDVVAPDGSAHRVGRLLSAARDNPKLAKCTALGYRVAGLTLAPAREGGVQVCPGSSPGCRAGCLHTAGVGGVFPWVRARRAAKTVLWKSRPAWFYARLVAELARHERLALRAGLTPAVRLNVLSDLPWERLAPDLFAATGRTRYWDYTKRFDRLTDPRRPANYHLTFSRSEANEAECREALALGFNVAVVFAVPPSRWARDRPRRWWGVRAVDGDAHDLRFLDPRGVVVALRAKGRARNDRTGFVVRPRADGSWPAG